MHMCKECMLSEKFCVSFKKSFMKKCKKITKRTQKEVGDYLSICVLNLCVGGYWSHASGDMNYLICHTL